MVTFGQWSSPENQGQMKWNMKQNLGKEKLLLVCTDGLVGNLRLWSVRQTKVVDF